MTLTAPFYPLPVTEQASMGLYPVDQHAAAFSIITG